MNFWEFLDKDAVPIFILGGAFFLLIAVTVGTLLEIVFNHREKMAKLKVWKLDGDKIVAAAKKHLPIRDGHYVIPEEWKAP